MARVELARYVAARKHLRPDGSSRSLAEIGADLGVSAQTVMRYLKAVPKAAKQVAAARNHNRGRKVAPWDF
jgi:predicted transcriptional regulator